jgi:hypothetical protein
MICVMMQCWWCYRSTQDIAVKVNATKMLEPQQVLELFTFLGMVNAGNKGNQYGKDS